MRFDDVAIPIAAAWSSPFVRWQGSLAAVNSIDLAVGVTGAALERAAVRPDDLDGLVVGITVPQQQSFYLASTITARLGAESISGPMISQACATGVARPATPGPPSSWRSGSGPTDLQRTPAEPART